MCRSKQLCSGGDPQKWGLHRLQVLKMDSCPLMTDVDLYHAVAALPELRCLSVQGDPAWTHHHRYQEQVGLAQMSCCRRSQPPTLAVCLNVLRRALFFPKPQPLTQCAFVNVRD